MRQVGSTCPGYDHPSSQAEFQVDVIPELVQKQEPGANVM